MSQPSTSGTPSAGAWSDFLKAHGYFLKHAIIVTLLTGVYLHLTALFIGRELLIEKILTPTFEALFAIPMTYAGIMGLVLWRRVEHPALWHAIVYGFIVFYFLASIPLHIQVQITGRADYILIFPWWYSYLAIALQLALLAFARTITIRSD